MRTMGDSVFLDRHNSYLGDYTWTSLSGRSVRLSPVSVQSLSELERARLQDVAYARLHQDYDLGCQITMPKDGQNRKKSLRRKLDSLSKEKNKDKDYVPKAFSIGLSQVIANDRTHRQRQDSYLQDPHQHHDHKDPSDLVASILQFATKRPSTRELSSSNSSLSSTSETAGDPATPGTPEAAPRTRRRGGMSVDSITDLDDNQSRLLEALQLSLPAETPSTKKKQRDKRLSLNPIYRQVPRVVDSCCQHLEKYGLQTVGIFRVGSSKKRVRQLREEFDRGVDVRLDEEHSVHDVAALLKEFLRDLPDPLLTKELYTPFINTMLLDQEGQQSAMQLLLCLLPACNSDTLQRLLEFLSTVANHAHDRHDSDGQEVPGNKMTLLNLATVLGPNLLHKQKSSDREFSVQSLARAEESAAVIAVLRSLITGWQNMFMVPPDLQNEVLMSLLETDPDVVDYLLRRKASQSPDLLPPEEPFSPLQERQSSSDSNRASSGEVSPYDNNSPVLSERRGAAEEEEPPPHTPPPPPPLSPSSSPSFSYSSFSPSCTLEQRRPLVVGLGGRAPRGPGANAWAAKDSSCLEQANIWGAWHATLKPGLSEQAHTDFHGNMSDGSSRSFQDGLDGLHGDSRQHQHASRRTQAVPGAVEGRPRPPRALSGPPASVVAGGDAPSRLPPPYEAVRHRLAGLSPLATQQQQARRPPLQRGSPAGPPQGGAGGPLSPEWQDWQRDRWQIWQLLSSDTSDTLPETLV